MERFPGKAEKVRKRNVMARSKGLKVLKERVPKNPKVRMHAGTGNGSKG